MIFYYTVKIFNLIFFLIARNIFKKYMPRMLFQQDWNRKVWVFFFCWINDIDSVIRTEPVWIGGEATLEQGRGVQWSGCGAGGHVPVPRVPKSPVVEVQSKTRWLHLRAQRVNTCSILRRFILNVYMYTYMFVNMLWCLVLIEYW